MPRPPTDHDAPRPVAGAVSSSPAPSATEPLDPLREAGELRALLQDAQTRVSRLLAALKHERRHGRALRAALASLRQLRLGP